jgi:hypothetical protein
MFNYHVRINWNTQDGTVWWNETCAIVLEVFGLPGHRFMYRPYEDYMVFEFKTKKDEDLCRILLSERI